MSTTDEHDAPASAAPGPLDFGRVLRAQIFEWANDYITTQDRIDVMRASETVLGSRWFQAKKNRVWFDKADDLALLIAEIGRFPRVTAESTDQEQALAAWLYVQRGKGDALLTQRRTYLDAVLPEWNTDVRPPPPKPTDHVPAIAEFLAANGRFPVPTADDESERVLGRWLNTRRVDARSAKKHGFVPGRMFTADFSAYMDELVPGWLGDGRNRDEVWKDTADDVVAFVEANDRWPNTKRENPEEHSKRAWLMYQRAAALGVNAAKLTESRRTYLNEVLPGWDAEHLWAGSVKHVLERDGGVPDLSLRAHLARLADAAEQPTEPTE